MVGSDADNHGAGSGEGVVRKMSFRSSSRSISANLLRPLQSMIALARIYHLDSLHHY